MKKGSCGYNKKQTDFPNRMTMHLLLSLSRRGKGDQSEEKSNKSATMKNEETGKHVAWDVGCGTSPLSVDAGRIIYSVKFQGGEDEIVGEESEGERSEGWWVFGGNIDSQKRQDGDAESAERSDWVPISLRFFGPEIPDN